MPLGEVAPGPGTKRWLVLLNCKAGTAARSKLSGQDPETALKELAQTNGVDAVVLCPEPEDLNPTLRRALAEGTYDAVIAAGGDGTVTSLAGEMSRVENAPAFGILPLGTFNHSAKELGVPADWNEAFAALASGSEQHIPIGVVSSPGQERDRYFLNFVTLGLHPEMVKLRDQKLKETGVRKWLGKWPAMLSASLKVLSRFRKLRVQVELPGRESTFITPAVYLCRNRTLLRQVGLDVAGDEIIQTGLTILVYKSHSRTRAIWLFALAAMGKLPGATDFDIYDSPTVTLQTRHQGHLSVAIDGEHVRLQTPVTFELRPSALKVLRPHGKQG